MKKTVLKTFALIGTIVMFAALTSCGKEENTPTNQNNGDPSESEKITAETPRSIVMGSDGNLYVTCYYPRCVARYNPSQNKVTGICELGNYQPEGIAEVGGKLYIASGYITDENNNYFYDNKLYIVDISSFKLTDSVTVGRNPNKVKKLDNGHIVFNTLGNYADDQGGLWIMDVNSKQISQVDVTLYNFDVYNGDIYGYTNIYSSDPLGFYKVDGTSHQPSSMGIEWSAGDNPYGIGMNPYNGAIIITTDGNYSATGDCYVFSNDGTPLQSGITLGNLPSKIVAIDNDNLLILNEGAWGANNSGISKVNVATGTATNNFFESANGRGLGDVAQDIILEGNKAYITVSFSNSIETMDVATGKSARYATAE